MPLRLEMLDFHRSKDAVFLGFKEINVKYILENLEKSIEILSEK